MSSFSIQCTTCKSRLKVRDASAIGQIVGCPKCGSMVLIEAPTEAPPTQQAQASAAAMAASMPDTVSDSQLGASFEEAASWFEEQEPETPAPASEVPAEAAADAPPPLPVAENIATSPPPPSSLAIDAPSPTTAHNTPPMAPPPPAEQQESVASEQPFMSATGWTSPATQHTRRIALVVGAAVLGIAGVVGLAVAVTSSGNDSPHVAVQEPPPAPDPVPTTDATPQEPAAEEPATPAEASVPAVEEVAKPETPSEPPVVSLPVEPIAPPVEEVATVEPPREPNPSVPPAAVEENPSEPETPLFTDPPAPTAPANTNSGLAALDALLPYLDGPPPAETPASDPPPQVSETQPPHDPNAVALLPEASANLPPLKPEPREVNVSVRLRDPIESIEMPNTPLIDFLRLMSDFSTIPITLDPVAMEQLKLTANREVSVVIGKTTVGEVLEKVVSRLNLVVEQGEGEITITHNRNPAGSLRQAKYSVSDLVGTDPQQLSQLRQLIATHIVPGTWQATGGKGEIEEIPGALLIRQVEPAHHEIVLFIEKLRLARGLALRSSYDPLLFNSQLRAKSLDPKLQQTVSLNYFEPTRLTTVVARLEKLGSLRILLDWNALLAEGWSPDTEVTLSVADATLGEALEQLTTDHSWAIRVIDSETLQLTTPTALAQRRTIEFYPVGLILQRKGWTAAQLQANLLPQLPAQSDQTRPLLSFDSASKSLIVSAGEAPHAAIKELLNRL